MLVLKNRQAPELSEENSHARLGYLKQLLKNIHPMMLASLCSLTKYITVATPKKNTKTQNGRLQAHSSIKKKDVATKCLRIQLMFGN